MTEGEDKSVSESLRQAASQGQFDLVKELVKTGAKFSSDQEGRTALHYAALNGHVDICKFLLQQGCSIDERDVLGYTPLHRAASKGHVEAIELLLTSKCNVDSQDEHGNGVIHESAWNGFSQTLELLIKHHCNAILTNKSGFTALHLASQNGHNQSARVLLYGGCNADLKNNYGDTALHTAARYGHAGVTRILISARCRLNEQNKNGDTALHISSALKRKKIAKLLVEAGIDVYIVNKQEETAIDVAKRKDHPEVIITITSLLKTKAQIHPSPKMVNFSEIPVDIDGPVVVPDEDLPVQKTEKTEKGSKFFSFLKKKKKEKDKPTPSGSQVHPTDGKDPVHGFFSQYIPKTGQQYFRDLAGNIKQGPIGYTPICQCMPALHQLEKRVGQDKEHIYEHIDASHRILKNRMDQLDKKTTQQITTFDMWSRDRFDEEERNCYNRIDQRLADQQHYMAHKKRGGMDVDDWLEAKLSEYGHCLDHHHDDTALPSNNIFTDIHQTENGRLFRSRSDETLSQSDNHSGKFRKRQFYESRQQAMQEIRAWQLPAYSKDRGARNYNPVVGRRDNYGGVQNPQTLNRNANQQSGRHFVSPVSSHQNARSSSRPDFISPSTASTSRSPYLSHDQVYGSQYSGYDQGAIPKKLSTSQTWHDMHEHQTLVRPELTPRTHNNVLNHRTSVQRDTSPLTHNTVLDNRTAGHRDASPLTHSTPMVHKTTAQRDASPLNHSTPKSRESSPFHYQYLPHHRMVKSQTEPENLSPRRNESRTIQSESRKAQSGSRINQSGLRNIQNDSRQVQNDRNIYSDNRQVYQQPRNTQHENTHSQREQFDRQNQNTHSQRELFDRQNEVRRSNMESRTLHSESRNSETRRSFPERGSSNISIGTNVTSNSSSTGQGPLTESGAGKIVVKPTFTTFGYPEREKLYNTQDNTNTISNKGYPNDSSGRSGMSVQQSDSTYGYHGEVINKPLTSGIPARHDGKEIPLERMSHMDRRSVYNQNTGNNVKNSAINSVNNVNRDDMYLSQGHNNMQMSRQRSRSTDGILLDDTDLSSAHQMKLKLKEPSSMQRSGTPSSPRNSQNHSVPLESMKRPTSQYGSSRSYLNDRTDMKPYSNEQNNKNVQSGQYYSSSQGNMNRNPVNYSVLGSKGQIYNSTRDVDVNRQNSGQTGSNRDRPTLAGDSTNRENPYGSVQNFTGRVNDGRTSVSAPSGQTYNTYNPNFQSHDNVMYSDQTNVSKLGSKSESHLNQEQHIQGQEVITRTDRNLQSTPIQDKSREDNSSNPDSGYSSKIYGRNLNSGNAPSTSCTPSSSFSTEPTDHNITLSSNNSPHPQVNHSDYAQINSVQHQYQKDLSSHVQHWYQRKLKDAAKNLNDGEYGYHSDYHSPTNGIQNSNDFSQYEYAQQSRQPVYHGNQTYSSYHQVPNFIRGSDV
ncbi:uncharacterized protein DDB_G0287625-like isoform X2 [Mytilus trossulus]